MLRRFIRAPVMRDEDVLVRMAAHEPLDLREAGVLRGALGPGVEDQHGRLQEMSVELLAEPAVRGEAEDSLTAKAEDESEAGLGVPASVGDERKILIDRRLDLFRRRDPVREVLGESA